MKAPEDTIAAISTPPGEGGIGIVRLSGPESIAVAASIFRSRSGRDPRKGGRIFYGDVCDEGAPVDEVLLHVMRAPHSYTCEDVVEINGHGGAAPLHAILELVLRRGARLAEPGEFTKRAFLNGRRDLVQAEAVIDRIRAHTRAGLRAAAAAAGGVL
ncbi:MAG: tRNA uridine-5-carboxymethylaminomethyl(34) synthesis GTPase MnmE, partial [Candidatus Hydrogenedentales bacterium]